MQDDNFKNIIGRKLNDADLSPPDDAWKNIELRLEKKKKRILVWFFFIGLVGVSAGLIYNNFSGEDEKIGEKNVVSEKKIYNEKISVEGKKAEENIVNSDKKNVESFYNVVGENASHRQRVSLQNIARKNPVKEKNFSSATIEKSMLSAIDINLKYSINFLPIHFENKKISSDKIIFSAPEKPHNKKQNNKINNPWSVGASAGLFSTFRFLSAQKNITNEQKNYIAARNDIEFADLDFSGGIFLKRKITEHLEIATGLNITHYSERLIFGNSPSILDKPMPAIIMDNDYKKANLLNTTVFKNTNDSITAPPADKSKRTGYSNTYYFSEIPLWASYRKDYEKYYIVSELGFSYMKLNVINATILEADGVGFTGVTETAHYSGIKNLFNLSLAVGGGIKIYNGVYTSALLQYKQSLNPLIDYGFVKQYPYSTGLVFRIEKRF